jgi:septal ring factor EnvC (AmiA/AmiB activator)
MFVTRRWHRRQVERLQGDLDHARVIIEGQRRALKSLQDRLDKQSERIAELEAEIKNRKPEVGDLK